MSINITYDCEYIYIYRCISIDLLWVDGWGHKCIINIYKNNME
jgi:hypothetical protein